MASTRVFSRTSTFLAASVSVIRYSDILAASVEATTRIEAHGVGRDRLLEMLDADSPAACKLVYEIDRTLAERMARTIATVAEVVSRLETPGRSDDIDVFRDQLVQDWGF